MCKKFQLANNRINTPVAIAEGLLSGTYEISQFPDLFRMMPVKSKRVLQHIIDQVRPMQIEVRSLQCQIVHLKERNERIDE